MHKSIVIIIFLLGFHSKASAAFRALATRLALRQQTIDQSQQYADHTLSIEEINHPERCLLGQIRIIMCNTLRCSTKPRTQIIFRINRQQNEIHMNDTAEFLTQLISKIKQDTPNTLISNVSCKFDEQDIIISIALNNSSQKKNRHISSNKKAAL